MSDINNKSGDSKKPQGNDQSEDNALDQELKDLIRQSELKSEALKKMMNKLNEPRNNDTKS